MDRLKAWILDRFQPVVLVAASPAAENLCLQASGLTVVDLLRPTSLVNQLSVPLRVGEFSTRIQEISLRFHAHNTIFQPKPEVIDEHLKGYLTNLSTQQVLLEVIPNLQQRVQSEAAEALTPWFFDYREEFLRLLRFSEHETLDQPLAGLLVIPGDVPDPVQHVEALLTGLQPPPLVAAGLMAPLTDASFPKHYVLLFDAAAGGEEHKATYNLALLQARFGKACCSLLKIRTKPGAPPAAPPELYRRTRSACLPGGGAGEPEQRPGEPPEGLGASISVDDLAGVAHLLRELCTGTLLPKMEERITRLNVTIAATRKGLKNRLSRLWKGAAAADGPSAQSEAPFPHTSVESQMRQLADLGFLLRQYEFAAGMYRLAAQDYKDVNNNRWYAGVEEMLGLCYVLAPDPATDPLKYFNRAIEAYPRSAAGGRVGRMLATRCAMMAAAFHAAAGRHHHAGAVLMAAHFEEEASRAALLLEGSAWCQLRGSPPQVRRAAFQLVLAGLRYSNAKQKRLAIHCYLQVAPTYGNSTWKAIREHLSDILGKQCLELGDTPGALAHTGQLLLLAAQAGRPPPVQQQHWEQYKGLMKRVAAQQGGHAASSPLQLPQLQSEVVEVSFSDQRLVGDPAAAGVGDSAWSKMEALLARGDMSSRNWLEGLKQVRDGEEYNIVAAKEPLSLRVTFHNPTQLKLKLTDVLLTCEFQPAAGLGQGAALQVLGQAAYQAAAAAAPVAPQEDQVLLHCSTLVLHPGEVLHEALSLVPSAPGWLRVTGVTWVTDGVVPGRAVFNIRGRHKKRPKGDRPSQRKHYPPQRRLLFQVLPPQPHLEVNWEALPPALHHGELLRVPLLVTNRGHAAAAQLRVAISSPFVAVGPVERVGGSSSSVVGGGEHVVDVLPPGWLATLFSLQAGGDHLSAASVHHQRHRSGPAALGGSSGSGSGDPAPSHARSKSTASGAGLGHPAGDASSSSSGAVPAGSGAAAAAPGGLHLVTSHVFHLHQRQGCSTSTAPTAAAADTDDEEGEAGGGSRGGGPLVLGPGERLVVPLWLHAAQLGALQFNCLWYWEPQVTTSTEMRYRVLRCAPRLPVRPLLSLELGVSPCPTHLASYLLRLDARGGQDTPQVRLTQLSCVTPHSSSTGPAAAAAAAGSNLCWQVAPVGPNASVPAALASSSWCGDAPLGQQLGPGESAVQYLQLMCQRGSGSGSTPTAAGAGGGGRGLLSMACGPVAYFLHQGQQQQRQHGNSEVPFDSSALAPSSSFTPPAATAAAGSGGQPGAVGEPVLDLVVMWQLDATHGPALAPAAAAVPGGDLLGAVNSSQQQQQVPGRCGMLIHYDLCAAQRLNPVRMLLEAPPQGQVTHDFRAASLCVVPLRLHLRNAGRLPVALAVRAGTGGSPQDTQHAWFTARPAGKAQARGAGAREGPLGDPLSAGRGGAAADAISGSSFTGRGLSPVPGGGGGGESVGGPQPPVQAGLPPSTPHVWCGVTEAQLVLGPGAAAEVGLQVGMFRPGVYVVEDYMLQWHYQAPQGASPQQQQQQMGGNKMGMPVVLRVSAAGGLS